MCQKSDSPEIYWQKCVQLTKHKTSFCLSVGLRSGDGVDNSVIKSCLILTDIMEMF